MGRRTHPGLSRREFLGTTAALALAGCAGRLDAAERAALPKAGVATHLDACAEGGIDLHIERQNLRVGEGIGRAITVNGSIPGPVIHMREGEQALIRVHNHMAESTSIHWHGILLPFTMDGVPGISFEGIPAGETFIYRYPVRQNGTYWYHSHTGMQEQLGLYGMIVISPRGDDPVQADRTHHLVLSDWTFEDPHKVLRNLKTMEGYYNFQRQTLANIDEQMEATGEDLGGVIDQRLAWQRMRMDPTDIADVTGIIYSYLMNGRTAAENPGFRCEPGERVRLRIANASAMSYYDVRIPGLPMTVVQADGQNVRPVEVDELRIAVAETYDVVVQLPADERSARTIFAESMDRSGYARGTLVPGEHLSAPVPERRRRPLLTMADMGMMMDMGGEGDHAGHGQQGHKQMRSRPDGDGRLAISDLPESIPHGPAGHGPASITMAETAYRQLDDPGVGLADAPHRVLTYGQLAALEPFTERPAPTREFDLHLTGNMHKYIWGFDGKKWSESDMIRFVYGERLRINFINDTMMNHPIHLHGMWMDLYAGHDYARNPRKHTVNVQPAELLTVDITADAPGQWAFHCHLLYHMEMGMFRTVAVVRSLEGGGIDAD